MKTGVMQKYCVGWQRLLEFKLYIVGSKSKGCGLGKLCSYLLEEENIIFAQ